MSQHIASNKCYLLLLFCCYIVSCYRHQHSFESLQQSQELEKATQDCSSFFFPEQILFGTSCIHYQLILISYRFIAPRVCHRLSGAGLQISPALLATGIRKWECLPDCTSYDEFYKTHACKLFQKAWRTEQRRNYSFVS